MVLKNNIKGLKNNDNAHLLKKALPLLSMFLKLERNNKLRKESAKSIIAFLSGVVNKNFKLKGNYKNGRFIIGI